MTSIQVESPTAKWVRLDTKIKEMRLSRECNHVFFYREYYEFVTKINEL